MKSEDSVVLTFLPGEVGGRGPQIEVAQLEWGDGSTECSLGRCGGGLREGPLRPLRGHLPLKGEDIVVPTE